MKARVSIFRVNRLIAASFCVSLIVLISLVLVGSHQQVSAQQPPSERPPMGESFGAAFLRWGGKASAEFDHLHGMYRCM